jgi:alkylation response protein AidB-like acyl-CoA dehydrogenase
VARTLQTFTAQPVPWPETAAALRAQVRALVAAHFAGEGASADPARRANSWSHADPAFSRALGAAGLVGMVWPRAYGGHERSALERYVVLEELLALGAPVGAHWIADRQTGGILLRYGTEEARRRWLPPMARGEHIMRT